jgi:hypothetical protein
MTYAGWTNYETWCVSTWINNDEGLYHNVRDHARHARNIENLTDWLKEFFTEAKPNHPNTLWEDLLTTALEKVNWYEIAKSEYDDE